MRPLPDREILREPSGQFNLIEEYLGTDREPEPLEVLSTDFTELAYSSGQRKAHLMAVIDVGSRCALGWAAGPRANRKRALRCWEQMHARMAVLGQPLEGSILHNGLDSVHTKYDWLRKVFLDHGLRVSFSERGAKNNSWIESLWGRMKTEAVSRIVEAQTLPELDTVIDERFHYYSRRRRHSQIAYVPPATYVADLMDQSERAYLMVVGA
jgi:transposase InsO family protein